MLNQDMCHSCGQRIAGSYGHGPHCQCEKPEARGPLPEDFWLKKNNQIKIEKLILAKEEAAREQNFEEAVRLQKEIASLER